MATRTAILVVDDEPEIRGLLLDCLEVHGYQVIAAPGAAEALGILGAHPEIGLLLTDVVMPGDMNGFELGRAAGTACPGLAVLYMSGYAAGELAGSTAGDLPAILQKPFRFERVLSAIAAALPAAIVDRPGR